MVVEEKLTGRPLTSVLALVAVACLGLPGCRPSAGGQSTAQATRAAQAAPANQAAPAAPATPTAPAARNQPVFTFGVIADVQYADAMPQGNRYYRDSAEKLKACVAHLATLKPDFVVNLGDTVDRDLVSYDTVLPIFEQLPSPVYFVLGNHDHNMPLAQRPIVLKKLGLDRLGGGKGYYDFARDGWRLVVLNGYAISLGAVAPDARKAGEAILADLRQKGAPNAQSYNGAVGPDQRRWLDRTLANADDAREKTIVICHHPAYPVGDCTLLDHDEVRAVLEAHRSVVAYLCGHNHSGGYAIKDGIHYLTFMGMIETKDTAYALAEVYPDRLQVTGFGREQSRVLAISSPAASPVGARLR